MPSDETCDKDTEYRSRKRIHVTIISKYKPMYKPGSETKEEQNVDHEQIKKFFEEQFGLAKQDIKCVVGQKVEVIKDALKNSEAERYDFFFYVFLTTLSPTSGDRLQFAADGSLGLDEIFDIVKVQEGVRLKPKLYLIQADDESVIPVITKGDKGTPKVVTKKIPQDADRLVIMSTIPQKLAQPDEFDTTDTDCSFLIQAFVKAMEDHKTDDLLTLTTSINGNVADKIENLNKEARFEANPLPTPLVT